MNAHGRTSIFLAMLAICTALTGCKSEHEEELEVRVGELERKLDDVRSHLDEANSAISQLKYEVEDLNSAISNFGAQPWREVIPEVEAAASEVEAAAEAAEYALANAISTLD